MMRTEFFKIRNSDNLLVYFKNGWHVPTDLCSFIIFKEVKNPTSLHNTHT